MLKISKMADYGTLVLSAMVSDPERIRSAGEIAALTGLPAPSVSKILKIFSRAGLVLSLLGAKGGYRLARPAAEISTAQVLQAIDGPIGMTECASNPGHCSQESACRLRGNWQLVSRAIFQALDQISLSQMAQPAAEALTVFSPPHTVTGPAKRLPVGEIL